MYKVVAKKKWGQHFLCDPTVTIRMVEALQRCCVEWAMHSPLIIEIGPGKGALTAVLLQLPPSSCAQLWALEIDDDCIAFLQQRFRLALSTDKMRLIHHDAMSWDFTLGLQQVQQPVIVVGNLPYNISSPLLFPLLHQRASVGLQIFMLQKEVVDRMVAQPGTKLYGRLSVMLQCFYQSDSLFVVPPVAFDPPPKVMSAVVLMQPLSSLERLSEALLPAMQTVVKTAFGQRRKQLANCLKPLFSSDEIALLGINPQARPETLSQQEFRQLAKAHQHKTIAHTT